MSKLIAGWLCSVAVAFMLTGCAPRPHTRAVEGSTPQARIAAIAELEDPALLARIAMQDPDRNVRIAAAKRVADAELAFRLASDSKDTAIRQMAVSQLKDPQRLSTIALKETEASVASSAIHMIQDQRLLTAIALNAATPRVRIEAVGKLDDEQKLLEVASRSQDMAVGAKAIEKITDQALLVRLATSHADAAVRKEALARIADPSLLIPVVEAGLSDEIAGELLNRYHQADLLTAVALHTHDSQLAERVVDKLDHADALSDITARATSEEVRRSARRKLELFANPDKLIQAGEEAMARGDEARQTTISIGNAMNAHPRTLEQEALLAKHGNSNKKSFNAELVHYRDAARYFAAAHQLDGSPVALARHALAAARYDQRANVRIAMSNRSGRMRTTPVSDIGNERLEAADQAVELAGDDPLIRFLRSQVYLAAYWTRVEKARAMDRDDAPYLSLVTTAAEDLTRAIGHGAGGNQALIDRATCRFVLSDYDGAFADIQTVRANGQQPQPEDNLIRAIEEHRSKDHSAQDAGED